MKELLIKLNACHKAIEWVGDKSLEEAWNTCHRGDWMLWLYHKMYPNNLHELTLAKGHCANTVRHLLVEDLMLNAIDTAIAFGEGKLGVYSLVKAFELTYDIAVSDADFAACSAADYTISYTPAHASAEAIYHQTYNKVFNKSHIDAASLAYEEKEANQRLTADICRQYLKIDFGDCK